MTYTIYKILSIIENRTIKQSSTILNVAVAGLAGRLRRNTVIDSRNLRNLIRAAKLSKNATTQELKKLWRDSKIEMYEKGSLLTMRELGVSSRGVTTLAKTFDTETSSLLDLYAESLASRAFEEIGLVYAQHNNELPAGEFIDKLKWQLSNKFKRNIEVLVRDQLGIAMQQAIYDTYEKHKDLISGYIWSGPLDDRTTEYCVNREAITATKSWSWEQVKKFKEENPLRISGKIVRAQTGTFLHPHIQCRHRLLAITR